MRKYLFFVLIALVLVVGIYIGLAQSKEIPKPTIPLATLPSPATVVPSPSPKPITFAFAGDAMFGRAVFWHNRDLKEIFSNFDLSVFKEKNISLLNLEGPIVDYDFAPDPTPDNLIFKFPPQTAETIKWLGVNTVSLANNHSSNQGPSGYQSTKTLLEQNSISYIGNYSNSENTSKTFDLGGKKLTIIALDILANIPDISETIKNSSQGGSYTIIYPHWGNEYQSRHSQQQERLAHEWIDKGATMVIGSHPHVIQDAEIYNNRPIFYSLGNFVFDQTFSQETQEGLILSGNITNHEISIELLPIISKKSQPELMQGEQKEAIITQFKKDLPSANWENGLFKLKF